MRYFAGDVLPGLCLSAAPKAPWVLPNGLSRLHRSRLVNLLAASLRRDDPGLRLVKLGWSERALLGARLRLGPNTLLWWRVKEATVVDPAAMMRQGCDLHRGPCVFDFSAPQPTELLVWLGPLKLAVRDAALDALYDESPIEAVDEAAEALREVSALVVSPVDLLDFANGLLSRLAMGERPPLARASALADVLAARLDPKTPAGADAAARLVARLASGRALEPEDRALLERVGLMDPGAPRPSPLVAALAEPELARCTLEAIVRLQAPGRPLRELVPPGLLGEAAHASPPALGPMALDTSTPRSRLTWDEAVVVLARVTRVAREGRPLGEEALQELIEALRAAEQATRRGALGAEARLDVIERVMAVVSVASEPPQQVMAALIQLASLALLADDLWPAEAALRRAWMLLASHDPPKLQAQLQRARGQLASRRFRLGEAEEALANALALARAAEDRGGEAEALGQLGAVFLYSGRLAPAEDYYIQALELFRRLADSFGEANTLQYLGHLYVHMDRLALAEESLTEALELFRRLEDSLGEANTLQSLGVLSVRTDSLAPAEDAYTEALQLFRRVENSLGEANTLQSLGDLYVRTERLAPAEDTYAQALQLYRRVASSLGEANTLQALGELYVRTERLASAEDAYARALQLSQRVEDSLGEANTLQALGDLYVGTARFALAENAYTRALQLFQRVESKLGEANTLYAMGRFAQVQRSLPEALALYSRAKALYLAIDARLGFSTVLAEEARCHAALGDLKRATATAQEALRIGQEIGNRYAVNAAKRLLNPPNARSTD